MTKVRVHGYLGQKYKKNYSFCLKNPREVFEAIECVHEGFIAEVSYLSSQGLNYDVIVNGQASNADINYKNVDIESIDIAPLIVGHGPVAAQIGITIASVVVSTAIQYILTPRETIEGAEIESSANKQSFLFSNQSNTSSQGTPVPIGYGRLKVGSKVVQSSIKSFPSSQESIDAMISNPFGVDGESVTVTSKS